MANPQTENGYIQIATEIYEALARTRIPGEAGQILNCIIRKTYGFKKKVDRIALSQFCLATGIKKPNIVRAVDKLVKMGLIIKKDNAPVDNLGSSYMFNKDFDSWKPLSKKITVIQKDNASLSKKIHTKETTTKEKRLYSVFSSWNDLNIIVHNSVDKFKNCIDVHLKALVASGLTDEEALSETISAMQNYKKVISGPEYFFKYRWTLKEFLTRGFDRFRTKNDPFGNFLTDKNKKGAVSETIEEQLKRNGYEGPPK